MYTIIPQGTVDNNVQVLKQVQKALTSHLLQATNPLIARHLSGGPNCAWL